MGIKVANDRFELRPTAALFDEFAARATTGKAIAMAIVSGG